MFTRKMINPAILLMLASYAVNSEACWLAQPQNQPNFVVIFLDDAGYGDFGCYGHPTIRTPNIDKMAAGGLKFTQFYSASPACTASRYGLLTGRYPIRSGLPWVLNPNAKKGIHDKEVTIAEALKDAGYKTACFGKWHLGDSHKFLPLQNGFDQYFGIPYSNDMQKPKWKELPLIDGDETVELEPDQTQFTRQFTERALKFIEANRDGPFFCFLPQPMPHVPLHASEAFQARSKRGSYGDVIEEIDWSVGQVIDKLDELGIAENTLVFFCSDNGPWIIKHQRGGSAGLFRDGKGSTWEGGMRVPGIAYWPGTIQPASVCNSPAATIDLLPTLCSLANAELPTDRTIDGLDQSALLTGESHESAREEYLYFGASNRFHAMRSGQWKLHIKTSSQTNKKYFDGKLPLLFDLESDPGEQYDLSDQHPEIVLALQTRLTEFDLQIKAEATFWSEGSQESQQPVRADKAESPFIQVLGIAQDAGFPQAACKKDCCAAAWENPKLRRNATCLAIVDPQTQQRWLVECTPDFREQLHLLDQHSQQGEQLLDGILLTHAHIGHYAGLIHLGREVIGSNSINVFCMPRMAKFLKTNGPWSQLVELENIAINQLEDEAVIQLNDRISVQPLTVPHRDEFSETVAYLISGPQKKILFLPDIDKWSKWETSIEELIRSVDVAYLDASFFGEGELPGRDM